MIKETAIRMIRDMQGKLLEIWGKSIKQVLILCKPRVKLMLSLVFVSTFDIYLLEVPTSFLPA